MPHSKKPRRVCARRRKENTARLVNVRRVRRALRALQRAAAFSNESPVKQVSFESLAKILFDKLSGMAR